MIDPREDGQDRWYRAIALIRADPEVRDEIIAAMRFVNPKLSRYEAEVHLEAALNGPPLRHDDL